MNLKPETNNNNVKTKNRIQEANPSKAKQGIENQK
jgi:hypothetical protein